MHNNQNEEERYERLDANLAEKDPADVENDDDDTELPRRDRLTAIIDSVEPQQKTLVDPDVVYADTDMNPNAQEEREVHGASADDIV